MPQATEPRRLFIVPTYHYDVAYLKTYDEYLPACFAILDEALRLLEENPDYTYMAEQVIILDEYLRARPEALDAMRRFANEGRFTVAPGQWVMPDMNHPGGETMFLQHRIGRDWLQDSLGLSPRVCWIADCWGHHAQLPQIIAQSGYYYYVFWRGMRRDFLKNNFFWQGLDGTQIRTHWLSRGYGNIRFPDERDIVNAPDLNFWGASPAAIEALCQELQSYGDSGDPVLLCNGGDMFYPQASAREAVARLRQAGLNLDFARPDHFLDAVDWENKPIFSGEFNGLLEGTYTTNIRIKQRARQLSNELLGIEALSVVAQQPRDLTPEWKPILKQQFHDIICGTITDEAVVDCHREFNAAEAALDTARVALGGNAEDAYFNPLGFERTEIIERAGRRISVSLPAFGSALLSQGTLVPEPVPVELPWNWENEFFRVAINEQGYINSLFCKRTQRELVNAEHTCPFGAITMQLDYGDSWLNFESPLNGGSFESSLAQNTPDPYSRGDESAIVNRGTFRPKVEQVRAFVSGAAEFTVEQRGALRFWRLGPEFTTTLRMRQGSPRLEYTVEMLPQGRHYRVRAAFPTRIKYGRRRDEIPFGIQSNRRGEQVVQNWIDWSDEMSGLALLNRGTPGANVDQEEPGGGVLLLSLFRAAAMEYKCESEGSFNEGVPHTFQFALVPHGAGAEVEIIREGQAFNQPPLQANSGGTSEWSVTPDNVFISGLRWRGPNIFCRVYEATGRPSVVQLQIPRRFSHWCFADGMENEASAWVRSNGLIEFELRPWEIAAVLLKGWGLQE